MLTRRKAVLLASIALAFGAPVGFYAAFSAQQARRLAALERALEADLVAERARPLERHLVLRGDPCEGETLRSLEGILAGVAAVASPDAVSAFEHFAWLVLRSRSRLAVFPDELESVRERLAPAVAGAQRALSCGSLDLSLDAETCGRRFVDLSSWRVMDDVAQLRFGFELEALRAIDEKRPVDAARLVLALLQLRQELAKALGPKHASYMLAPVWNRPGLTVVLSETIASADIAALDELDRGPFPRKRRASRSRPCRFRSRDSSESSRAAWGKRRASLPT